MKMVLLGVAVFWVAVSALAVPHPSWGSETGNPGPNKAVVENQGKGEQTDQQQVFGEESEETPENKPVTPSNTGQGEAKTTGATQPPKTGPSPKKIKRRAQEDRPWTIKEHPRKKSDAPKKKPAPLDWKSDAQQSACETGLKDLKKTLEKARTYSIRGDHCATAKHAKDFLGLEDRLRNECPHGFLESKGYSEKIIQNVRVLLELGKKACLEKE